MLLAAAVHDVNHPGWYECYVPWSRCFERPRAGSPDKPSGAAWVWSHPLWWLLRADCAFTNTIMHCCAGFANGYMVNTSTEAAITWNDISVNENMHAATAFQLLRRPACNFLAGLDADDYRFVRRTVIGIVLATDMASHAELLADFSGEDLRCRLIGVQDSHALAVRCGMLPMTDMPASVKVPRDQTCRAPVVPLPVAHCPSPCDNSV